MTETVDSKAYAVTLIMKIPYIILWGLAGAIIGSGLYLLCMAFGMRNATYSIEKEYYVTFTQDWSKDYYNDYTWNDIMSTDPILGEALKRVEGYSREEAKQMIEARVFSDVRYVTVFFKGQDSEYIKKLSDAMNEAIIAYADTVEELGNIKCIEEGQVLRENVDVLSKRAAILGFIAGVIIYIFIFSWKFALLDCMYTRYDILRLLEMNGLAMREYKENLDYLVKPEDSVETLLANKDKRLILAIPQGKPVRRSVEELLISAAQENIAISGAVLVKCSKTWLKLYGVKNIEGVYGVK